MTFGGVEQNIELPQLRLPVVGPRQAVPISIRDDAAMCGRWQASDVGLDLRGQVHQVEKAAQLGRVHFEFTGQGQPPPVLPSSTLFVGRRPHQPLVGVQALFKDVGLAKQILNGRRSGLCRLFFSFFQVSVANLGPNQSFAALRARNYAERGRISNIRVLRACCVSVRVR
ncbi:MAG: hypothetical protein A2992_00740 [Elusimicrobia bacterium RIFCSPLOWO2_01_FULL_59_12]|nr:MAG: hypothetical protein A2992_00740 [Elusimicrobia bacterium RIFCSPLOWO2_01_FULL_59_12]